MLTLTSPGIWPCAPGKRKVLKHAGQMGELLKKLKDGIRAKVEHPFRVIKRQFGYMKARYRGLTKNAGLGIESHRRGGAKCA